MVVPAFGVDRDRAALAGFKDLQRIMVRSIVEADHDHRAHLGPQRLRIAAALGGGLHPDHVAVRAFGKELLQPLLRERGGVRACDADGIEAVLPGFGGERRFQIHFAMRAVCSLPRARRRRA
jgi:hypothetical protein